MAKALAQKHSKNHRSHDALRAFMEDFIAAPTTLYQQWTNAEKLHQHFYNGHLDIDTIKEYFDDVRELCQTITTLLQEP